MDYKQLRGIFQLKDNKTSDEVVREIRNGLNIVVIGNDKVRYFQATEIDTPFDPMYQVAQPAELHELGECALQLLIAAEAAVVFMNFFDESNKDTIAEFRQMAGELGYSSVDDYVHGLLQAAIARANNAGIKEGVID